MYQQNLVYVIDSLGAGGAERALLNVLPEVRRHYDSVVVVVLFTESDLLAEYLSQDITVIQMKFSRRWNLFANSWALGKILKAQQADIVHAHLIFSGIYLGLTRFMGLRCKRVITFHNLAYVKGCNPRNLSYFLRKSLNWLLLSTCYSQFVAVSSAVADHYSQNLRIDRAKIEVIGNGLVAADFEGRRLSNDLTGGSRTIIAVGRLVPEKGYSYLIEAFEKLSHRFSATLQLQIIGDGPLRSELESKSAALGLSERVEFCGSIAHEQVVEKLSAADFFVLASVFEGFGLAVAEAILMQLPVVVTNVGGVMDVVDPVFAEIVEAADADGLADAIERVLLLDAKQLQDRAKVARNHVEQKFSSRSIASQLSQLYQHGSYAD